MRRRTNVLVGIGVVALVAFILFAPVVPFSRVVYTGLPSYEPLQSPRCTNPLNISGDAAVNAPLSYKGYESLSQYVGGFGVMFYTECTVV